MFKMSAKLITAGLLAVAGLALVPSASASSCTGSGCSVNVTFNVTIPSVFRFTVGAQAAGATVNFATSVTAANIGTGAVSPNTVTNGGVGTNGTDQVYYRILSNQTGSTVSVAATAGNMLCASGGCNVGVDAINLNTISATNTGSLAHPTAGGAATSVPMATVTDQSGLWTYSYSNASVYPAGLYTGTMIYTATVVP
jgi:hypothetical protein